ncbi:MAG: GNAT family N-acetyltransferase [Candidatus Eremiobacteraeota bacterium]|nr:GNAT family N-acetyltransferase [Candidatus Eremiobacteraeota bacterium]
MQYRIRPAKKNDIKNIIQLASDMVEHSISPLRDVLFEDVKEYRKKDLDSLYSSIKDPNIGIFIAETMNGEFIGHVISMSNFVESSTGESQGYVFDLSVRKKFNRLGIGARLMEIAEEYCQDAGMKYMALNVTASNMPAVKFYESQGYSVERKRMLKVISKPEVKNSFS